MKIEVKIKKGKGDFFPSDNLTDGSIVKVPKSTADELIRGDYVELVDKTTPKTTKKTTSKKG
jgi:hypothetical protein